MIITIDKPYRTKSGRKVKLLHIFSLDYRYPLNVFGVFEDDLQDGNWVVHYWQSNGSYGLEGLHEFDLVEDTLYTDININDKVMVWNHPSMKYRRYFAGVNEEGKPLTFGDGRTSWSGEGGIPIAWEFCEKVEDSGN